MSTVLCRLSWGLGDVLLTTSAIREYKRLNPDDVIYYETFVANRTGAYQTEYPNGFPAEMLLWNPDIAQIIDWGAPPPERPDRIINFHYAEFGGPSLDYSIQAHFWENMGLTWEPGQRFDSHYYLHEYEVDWVRSMIGNGWIDEGLLVLTPQTGWPGKAWNDAGWFGLIDWALREGLHPVILAGHKLAGARWNSLGVVNLSGQLNMRQSAAVLSLAEHAVMTEGGLSNLRFALGKPAVLMTCATQVGVAIWTPPELTTEVRAWQTPDGDAFYGAKPLNDGNTPACESCMWRREHVKSRRADVPPASIRDCPADRSLRDVPVEAVVALLKNPLRV